jgi:EAL domain-containing protein (putative c-di-GMP-specific phosphodiesterase class I)
MPPEELTELAEETGLIIPLGSWALGQAITDMAGGRGTDPGPRQPGIAVKLSARQFQDADFVPELRHCLDEAGMVPPALMVELAQRSLLRRDELVVSGLAQLKDLGVRLAIDDFSIGYCPPGYLKELAVDVLKIGRPVVDAVTDPQGRKLAQLAIGLADAIDVEVIADGIETAEQCALLAEIGCQLGQGSHLGMPRGCGAGGPWRTMTSGDEARHNRLALAALMASTPEVALSRAGRRYQDGRAAGTARQ